MNKLDTLREQAFEEFLLNISSVSKDLSIEHLCKYIPHLAIPVIHVGPSKTECDYLTRIVAKQVKFEAMTPAHRPFSVLGEPRKDFVEIPSYVVAYGDHCVVNECYPRTLAESIELHKEHHFAEYTRHELFKAIIGYRMGELFVEGAADTILIILLKIAIGTEMIAYKNCHHLTFGKPSFTISVTLSLVIIAIFVL